MLQVCDFARPKGGGGDQSGNHVLAKTLIKTPIYIIYMAIKKIIHANQRLHNSLINHFAYK